MEFDKPLDKPLEQEEAMVPIESQGRKFRAYITRSLVSMDPAQDLQHFDVDSDAKTQGERHDIFNLLALPVVIGLILWNMNFIDGNWQTFWWIGQSFYILWWITLVYFIIDLVWVIVIPICVKSPPVILVHHSVTGLYLLIPFFNPQYGWMMGALLSVEVNTWFLIMRRTHNKARLEAWEDGTPVLTSLRLQFVTVMFYFTWITVRLIVYPIIFVLQIMTYYEVSQQQGYFNVLIFALIIQSVLILLNLKWSWDLFFPAPKKGDDKSGRQGL